MIKLTKDEIRELPPDKQIDLARIEVRRFQLRKDLLKRTRRGYGFGELIFQLCVFSLSLASILYPRLLPIALIFVMVLVAYHANRLHRRLDAVMEWLEVTSKNHSDDDHVA